MLNYLYMNAKKPEVNAWFLLPITSFFEIGFLTGPRACLAHCAGVAGVCHHAWLFTVYMSCSKLSQCPQA